MQPNTRAGTTRVCFRLKVKVDRIDEYIERHRQVWPEMLAELTEAGWTNYSLFLDDSGLLIGYFETPSLDMARERMRSSEVNSRWQAEMNEFFVDMDESSPEDFLQLQEVFHLETQLDNVRTPISERDSE